jgi:hypothetical protein
MKDNDLYWEKVLPIALSISAIIVSIAIIMIVISHSNYILTGWIILFFQILITLVTVIIVIILLNWLISKINISLKDLNASVSERVFLVEQRFQKEIDSLRRQVSPIIAGLLLLGQTLISVTDKAIVGSPITKICVLLGLTVWFWISNNHACSDKNLRRVIGIIMWFLGVASIPFIIAKYYQKSFKESFIFILTIDSIVKIFFISMILILLFLPLFFQKKHERP